jgi:cytochrome c oxidase assembly protein subunit 15
MLRQLANLSGIFLVLQILVGFATFHLHLQVEPLTVTHQAVGAALLGGLVAYTVLAVRDRAVPSTSI